MIHADVWVLYSDEFDNYVVVNFAAGNRSIPWIHHGVCSFGGRRWWRLDRENNNFLQGSENTGEIYQEAYAPNE